MRRFILTGPPGAGKTTLLQHLGKRGYSVVEEAASDIIALEQKNGIEQPWTVQVFIEKILALQKQRQAEKMSVPGGVQFFDRAPLDTYVLCKYLEFPVSSSLLQNFKEVQAAGHYEKRVFFIESLGFIEPTEARQISYEDSLRFGQMHEDIYREWGYECIKIPPDPVAERIKIIKSIVSNP